MAYLQALAFASSEIRDHVRQERAALMEAVKTHSVGQISHVLYDAGGGCWRNM